ncbi:hypothetical protein MMC30_006325 [Trapelia coarctata]|nr:hypothetical protein [Trapelia coarctata]
MPSPLNSRRTSNRRDSKVGTAKSTPPKPKPVDLGIPLGPYDSNSVRDRVRQWQAQGGGVITASDIYVEEEVVEPTAKGESAAKVKPTAKVESAAKVKTPKQTDKRTVTKKEIDTHEPGDLQTPKRRAGRRKDKVEVEEQSRQRSESAPKKRVVSDAHWRKNRSPPESATSSTVGKEPPPQSVFDGGIRVRPIPDKSEGSRKQDKEKPRSKFDGEYKESMAKVLPDDGIRVRPIPDESEELRRHGKGKGKEKARSRRASLTDNYEPRSYDKPTRARSKSDYLRTPEVQDYRSSSHESDEESGSPGAPTSTSSKTRQTSKQNKDPNPEPSLKLGSSAAVESIRRKYDQVKERSPEKPPRTTQGEFAANRGSGKSHKGNILSQVIGETRRAFSRTEVVAIPTPRIPTIEAWLSDTPDPFVDEDESPIDIPAPLKSTSKRRKDVEVVVTEDPNKIWEALNTRERATDSGLGSRRRRRVRSSTLDEGNVLPTDLSSGSPRDSRTDDGVSAAKLVDIVHDKPDLSPPASPSPVLQRRGARRKSSSPAKDGRKSSPLKESFTPDENLSLLSSTNTTSSVEPTNPYMPLRPPGLNVRRPFPSTGLHRLSTIASVETFNSKAQYTAAMSMADLTESAEPDNKGSIDAEDLQGEARDHFDPNGLARRPSKNRLAKHSDLISVLSLPMGKSRSIRSARSIRTNRSRLANATIEDLMAELATDESKYMRELRTLVDGVIPVLLTCVLSKSDSAVAAGLFSASAHGRSDPNITKPIIEMGVTLERLKTLHKRIPLENPNVLLTWAHGAQKVYSDYLKAWRMGFQDVVVNLAPAPAVGTSKPQDDLDQGLPRNEDGDVINTNGERVDVAHLLKRPLVRLKYLAKTLKGVNFIKPSPEAEVLATKYQNLVIDARHRSNMERARLEDEAAANIDPTRARDPRTLCPLAAVTIDKARRVRARDYFNLAIQHSSGQRIDCRAELLLRDDAPDVGTSGDLLICEVDGTGRWLLFPPVLFGRVSARNGDHEGEIVVMIRGTHGQDQEWHELLSLHTEDEQTGFEWVQMLGLVPIPPKIVRSQSFVDKRERRKTLSIVSVSELELSGSPRTPTKSRTPSPREVEVPIGEQASITAKTWVENKGKPLPCTPASPASRERTRLQKKLPPSPPVDSFTESAIESDRQTPPRHRRRDSVTRTPESTRSPRSLNEALHLAGTSGSGLRRARAKRHSRHADDPRKDKSPSTAALEDDLERPSVQNMGSPPLQSPLFSGQHSPPFAPSATSLSETANKSKPDKQKRPTHHRSRSSAPSLELPIIPKVRKESPPPTPRYEPEEEPQWPSPSVEEELPITPPKLSKKRSVEPSPTADQPPPPPAHRTPSPVQVPELNATAIRKPQRRTSSPLKHQYEPSTASESSSDSDSESDASTVEHNEATSVSDSSEDEELEDGDAPTPLIPLGALQRLPKVSPQGSLYSQPNGTLTPSQSASQAPFKRVPAQPNKASKTIASIFYWSEKGSWQSLHPDECSIVVTPGLIEAFEMSAAHSHSEKLESPPQTDNETASTISAPSSSQASDPQSPRPLIALELTPLVPIRRGTALDISIRSPPTAESKITSLSNNNNIMFRSRNPEECEALYALINYSRINNPTYIALQNARVTSFHPTFDRSLSTRGASRATSWFGLGHGSRSSYRASSAPTPSISMSESSIGSMSSAFSALKRFGLAGSRFSISRSTVTSRNGSRANSIYTSSDHSSGSGTSTPTRPGASGNGNGPPLPAPEDGKLGAAGGPIGLSNAKIRLYVRETASKWRDLGSARLTIMRPTNAAHPLLVVPGQQGPKQGASDKRIVVIGKAKGETLLDVTLGESCFERVARTGIAVSVWETFEGGMAAKEGGVVGGRLRVFMIQMKGEAETAYTFSIVGKLRY